MVGRYEFRFACAAIDIWEAACGEFDVVAGLASVG